MKTDKQQRLAYHSYLGNVRCACMGYFMHTLGQHYRDFYQTNDPRRFGRSEMPRQRHITADWLKRTVMDGRDRVILELGCGMGALRDVHPNYIGSDLSFVALTCFVSSARRIQGDIQQLPFKDERVDFCFSWATLEHVPRPDCVLSEITRVLKPGGVALLTPSWFCRPWAAKGLPVRSYLELSWPDRINKATIPLRNSLIWRSALILPARLFREIRAAIRSQPLSFEYRRLSPNLAEYIYTDCDAFASLDPHAAILYFKTRGWKVLSHPKFKCRIMARHQPVVVQKPVTQVCSQER